MWVLKIDLNIQELWDPKHKPYPFIVSVELTVPGSYLYTIKGKCYWDGLPGHLEPMVA